MNFQKTSKMMLVFLLSDCFLHASEQPTDQRSAEKPVLASFLSFVQKVTGLVGGTVTHAVVDTKQAIVAQVQHANQTMAELEMFLESPQFLPDFYKQKCICPDSIDPELFKILVEIAFAQLAAQQDIVQVSKAYRQDQSNPDGLCSDFGKAIQKYALALKDQPLCEKGINLNKLPEFLGKIPISLKPHIDEMRTDAQGRPRILVDELAAAACQMFERLPLPVKKTKIRTPRDYHEMLCQMYSALGGMFYDLEPKNHNTLNAECYQKNLIPYLAVIRHCMQSGDLDYYRASNSQEFIQGAEQFRVKVAALYRLEKLKYLFNAECVQREFVKNEANCELLIESAKQGVLSPETFKHWMINARNDYKSLGEVLDRDGNKIKHWAAVDQLRIKSEKEDLQQRALLQKEFEKDRNALRLSHFHSLWNASGRQIVRERIQQVDELKSQEQIEIDQALQHQQNREQQTMLNRCEKVKTHALISYAKYLKRLGREAEQRKSTILEKEKSALQLQENIDCLQTNSNKLVVLKYWKTLQKFVPIAQKNKKLAMQLQQDIDHLKISNNKMVASKYWNILKKHQANKTEMRRLEQLSTGYRHDPYNNSLIPVVGNDDERVMPDGGHEFSGWAQDDYGNWFYWPGAGQEPGYWNPHTKLLEW